MVKRSFQSKRIAVSSLMTLALALMSTPTTRAAELGLSDSPLLTRLGVMPNIFVTLDDSGSMNREHVPAAIAPDNPPANQVPDNDTRKRARSYKYYGYNRIYYNPHISYVLPIHPDNTTYPVPSFTSACNNGFDQSTCTVNLATSFKASASELTGQRGFYCLPVAAVGGDGAIFKPGVDDAIVFNDNNFTCQAVTTAEEQNFAIWYSYYRRRILTTKTALGLAFASVDNVRLAYQRLNSCNTITGPAGLGNDPAVTAPSTDPVNYCPGTVPKLYSPGTQVKTNFYNWVYATNPNGGTPTRQVLKLAGDYLTTTGKNSPWAEDPGVSQGTESSCRQNFHILFTDGIWTSGTGIGTDADSTGATLPDGKVYTPGGPNQEIFPGTGSDTLADTTWHYWSTDLRPDLANDVPKYIADDTGTDDEKYWNPLNDPATWQHMVQYIVLLAADGGTLSDPADLPALLAGTKSWPAIVDDTTKEDDTWHATINARGVFVSAQNPQSLRDAFNAFINDVNARTSSNAPVALNSGSLDTNSRLYQARFNSGNWSGQLLAFDINPDGSVKTPAKWDANQVLGTNVAGNGWDIKRRVITFDGTQGIPFRWASLPTSMQAELNNNGLGVADAAGAEQGQARLEYLRGSVANEGGNGNNYRRRSGGKLGDIVNGAPAFVGGPGFNYPDNLESGCTTGNEAACYSKFASSNVNREPMVYVGANDGMLHGFDAGNGEELIAYIPDAVFSGLTRLTSPLYTHHFFVDGPPTVGDAFYGGGGGTGAAWHTVLVGGLRNGGQGIYALDVTNPLSFSEGNASNLALWEFTDADDPDLGYTYSRPAIVRLHNGVWAAVFGNGYNNTQSDGATTTSTTGDAVLYIVDIQSGSLIKKIDTGVGQSDPASNGRPNGLATPAPVDVNGDRIIDYVYAGDLFGNLWKFDVRDADPANWGVAYGGSPLYVARDGSGTRQPITVQPEIGLHPVFDTGSEFFSNGGYIVYFGSGQYIETTDNVTTNAQTQSFYGIWDPDRSTLPTGMDRSNLLQQSILEETTTTAGSTTFTVRLTSKNQIHWRTDPFTPMSGDHLGWFMDLIVAGSSDNRGERQVTTPTLRNGRIIFTTLIPSAESCVFGGTGFLVELDASDGSQPDSSPFDFDNNGQFDLVTFPSVGNATAPSGIGSTGGAPSSPNILDAGAGTEYKYLSGTDEAKIQVVHEKGPAGFSSGGTRESWRQLQ